MVFNLGLIEIEMLMGHIVEISNRQVHVTFINVELHGES